MQIKEGQSFLDLYYEPGAVEFATGASDHQGEMREKCGGPG